MCGVARDDWRWFTAELVNEKRGERLEFSCELRKKIPPVAVNSEARRESQQSVEPCWTKAAWCSAKYSSLAKGWAGLARSLPAGALPTRFYCCESGGKPPHPKISRRCLLLCRRGRQPPAAGFVFSTFSEVPSARFVCALSRVRAWWCVRVRHVS